MPATKRVDDNGYRALVDLSWIESTEVKEVGTIKKGWYRLKAKQVKEPTVNEKGRP